MNRKTVILNLVNNYSKHGVTEDMINDLIDSGIEAGLNYDAIYLGLDAELSGRYGHPFYCSSQDMARAFGIPEEEINRVIEEQRKELIEAGEDPDEYFRTTNSTKFMM